MKEELYVCALCLMAFIILVQLIRHRKTTLTKIDDMSGEEFEEWIATVLIKSGYDAYLTQASHDFGADVIANKDNVKLIIQAKRYGHPVGIKAVQELFGALAYYKDMEEECEVKGLVVTNSTFTAQAKSLAAKCDILLWDRDYLVKNILSDKKNRRLDIMEDIPEFDDTLKIGVVIGDNNQITIYSSKSASIVGVYYEDELDEEAINMFENMKVYR